MSFFDDVKNNFYEKRGFLVGVWIFFVFMMVFNLTHSSLWGDEWVEYTISQLGILNRDMFHSILGTFQPPLYNFIMHFWLLINKGILWFRLFNVFLGIVSGIALYKTLCITTNKIIGGFSLLVLGATYEWIYCIQECSEYALMLMFLFLAIYFYVLCCQKSCARNEICFVLCCVLAMYSQYGSFFVVLPLLILNLINSILRKDKNSLQRTILLYSISFVVFALPLFFVFAQVQISAQSIMSVKDPDPTMGSLGFFEILPMLGKMFSYFWHLNNFLTLKFFLAVVGIGIVVSSVFFVFFAKTSYCNRSLTIMFISSYVLFFVLVFFQIYAMTHPGLSAGFYSRYAYFFIPVFFVVLPTTIYELVNSINNQFLHKITVKFLLCLLIVPLLFSFPIVLDNWEKTHDAEFAQIWYYNSGFSDNTFLVGAGSRTGFEYYTQKYNFDLTGRVFGSEDLDINALPDSFWIWRSNWSGDKWQEAVDVAKATGYDVVVYADYGYAGQLAHCVKK